MEVRLAPLPVGPVARGLVHPECSQVPLLGVQVRAGVTGCGKDVAGGVEQGATDAAPRVVRVHEQQEQLALAGADGGGRPAHRRGHVADGRARAAARACTDRPRGPGDGWNGTPDIGWCRRTPPLPRPGAVVLVDTAPVTVVDGTRLAATAGVVIVAAAARRPAGRVDAAAPRPAGSTAPTPAGETVSSEATTHRTFVGHPPPPALTAHVVCTRVKQMPHAATAVERTVPNGCTDIVYVRGVGVHVAGPRTRPSTTPRPPAPPPPASGSVPPRPLRCSASRPGTSATPVPPRSTCGTTAPGGSWRRSTGPRHPGARRPSSCGTPAGASPARATPTQRWSRASAGSPPTPRARHCDSQGTRPPPSCAKPDNTASARTTTGHPTTHC